MKKRGRVSGRRHTASPPTIQPAVRRRQRPLPQETPTGAHTTSRRLPRDRGRSEPSQQGLPADLTFGVSPAPYASPPLVEATDTPGYFFSDLATNN